MTKNIEISIYFSIKSLVRKYLIFFEVEFSSDEFLLRDFAYFQGAIKSQKVISSLIRLSVFLKIAL